MASVKKPELFFEPKLKRENIIKIVAQNNLIRDCRKKLIMMIPFDIIIPFKPKCLTERKQKPE